MISECNLLPQLMLEEKIRERKREQLWSEDENTGQKICGQMKGGHLFANKLLDQASCASGQLLVLWAHSELRVLTGVGDS